MKNLTTTSTTSTLTAGQIVRGARAGTFVVLGFRTIGGEEHVQVQSVNPLNHTQRASGTFALATSSVVAV